MIDNDRQLVKYLSRQNKIKKINPGLAQEDYKFGLQTEQPGHYTRYTIYIYVDRIDWIGWIGPVGWDINAFLISEKSKLHQV